MLVVCFLFLLSTDSAFCYNFLPNYLANQDVNIKKIKNLTDCFQTVLTKYYEKGQELTYVDVNSSETDIIELINKMVYVLLLNKSPGSGQPVSNEGYFVNARNATGFIEKFPYLKREKFWNPFAKFVIVIEELKEDNIVDIFKEVLKLHVINVIVINGTDTAEVYTYDPFENLGCGKRFDRVIGLGQCSTSTQDFFPDKLVNGLQNCTISVAIPHIPPYTYHNGSCDLKQQQFCFGTDQFVFQMLSEMEKFNVNFVYANFAESDSMINEDMTITGFFNLIEKNKMDGLFGLTALTDLRSLAFSFFCWHSAVSDELIYIVKRADFLPNWKYIYIEFNTAVWVLTFITFIFCAALIVFLTKPKDIGNTIMKLWDTLFLHGFNLHCRSTVKSVFMIWAWFAYMINSFYQSSLMSLTTNPVKDYQVSTTEDLKTFSFKPCVIPGIRKYLAMYSDMTFEGDVNNCEGFIPAMEKISRTDNLYSLITKSTYYYNAVLFNDETGTDKLYFFDRPVMKLIYAMFFYKGFPLTERLQKHVLTMQQFGMIERHMENIYYQRWASHVKLIDKTFKSRLVVPWVLFSVGAGLATFVFVLEVLGKNREYCN